ncbi:MAG: hypothetical protein OER88_02965, partial [Planctomycetota bacterium]|nr:hypothetical protein [Planctomycetota bacterium]
MLDSVRIKLGTDPSGGIIMKPIWYLTLLCAVALAGCGDDVTVVQGADGILLVGSFPGDQTIDHFVGDDG